MQSYGCVATLLTLIWYVMVAAHITQFADQGYLEVDGSYEWDNDYPNPVRLPSRLKFALAQLTQFATMPSFHGDLCHTGQHIVLGQLVTTDDTLRRSPTHPPTS